ncbi:hypothetical protein R1sor_022169 [Riccia sorocarpa]|uniref:Uncharacterized protein n=1 Tax=Riccia sorocarpa TaxID=122646 RepID=A0ABD3GJ35_9MARC
MIREDYEAVVAYIEIPENFRQVMGGGRKTPVGGKCMSKAQAFNIMAAHLRNVDGFPDVTGEEMKKRFDRYVSMYKKAKGFKESTGRGLSEKELEKGMTIEEKVEKICPHFASMHAILGQRANIAPPAEESCGLPNADVDWLGLDSQPPPENCETEGGENDEELSEEDADSAAEGLTAVGAENIFTPCENSTPRSSINLVDLEYGSDEDGEEKETNNFMYEDFNEGEDYHTTEKEDVQIPDIETSGVEETPAMGQDRVNGRGRRHNNNVQRQVSADGVTAEEDSRNGSSRVKKNAGKEDSTNIMSLYEEGLRNKLEFRKAFIEYRGIREFFDLPLSEKVQFLGSQSDTSSPRYGRTRRGTTGLQSWRDQFHHRIPPLNPKELQTWPDKPEAYRETVLGSTKEIQKLWNVFFDLLAEGYNLEPRYFQSLMGAVENSDELDASMLAAYYPRCPQADLAS